MSIRYRRVGIAVGVNAALTCKFLAMRPVPMSEAEAQIATRRQRSPAWPTGCPSVSARSLFTLGTTQRRQPGWSIAAVIGLVLNALAARSLRSSASSPCGYLIARGLPLHTSSLGLRRATLMEIVTDEEALSVPDSELPFYTILASRVQRSLGDHQAGREPRPDGLSR